MSAQIYATDIALAATASLPRYRTTHFMQISHLSEQRIVANTDEPTQKMLALWHQHCRDVLGNDMEVCAASRYDHALTKGFSGELNTAIPMSLDGKPTLLLLFENMTSVEEVIVTHEIGHQVLNLQGFKGVHKQGQPHTHEEMNFNSMCQHPALYALQRSIGHDPQEVIDGRTRRNLSKTKIDPSAKVTEPSVRWSTVRVLQIADDIFNCSADLSESFMSHLKEASPDEAKCVLDLCDIRDSFDPANLDSYPAFVREAKKRLGFGTDWIVLDELPGLRKLAARQG